MPKEPLNGGKSWYTTESFTFPGNQIRRQTVWHVSACTTTAGIRDKMQAWGFSFWSNQLPSQSVSHR